MPFKSKAQRRKFAELLVKGEISEETFEAVQAILKSQDFPQKKIAKKTVHIFAGFVYCQCGNKMYVPNKGVSYICSSCRNKVGV